jgi:putative ABC transport system permease protein
MIPFRTSEFSGPDLSEGAFPLGRLRLRRAAGGRRRACDGPSRSGAGGFLAGCCTAFIHLRFRIHTLLAGILMMTMLYSINLRIMGKSNLSVFGSPTVY